LITSKWRSNYSFFFLKKKGKWFDWIEIEIDKIYENQTQQAKFEDHDHTVQ
jgi:hypothetical protein